MFLMFYRDFHHRNIELILIESIIIIAKEWGMVSTLLIC